MDVLVRNAWLVPFFPLLGGLIAAVGGKWLKGQSHLPVVAGIALAFLVSLGLLGRAGSGVEPTPIEWLTITGLNVPIQFQADGLTTMMLSMVTFVATLVAIYASGYMAGDPGYPRFFAIVGLFVFSMTGLVLSANYLLTYVFWEGVGVCSYLLVGFWHSKPEAAAAAKKAFLVNRVGDVGFAIAIFWMWTSALTPEHPDLVSVLDYSHFLGHVNIENLADPLPGGPGRDPAPAVLGGDGQECPGPALRLAPGRDGRPHAGLGPDPRGDDGHGRRLPDRPVEPAADPGARRPAHGLGDRLRHRPARGPRSP